MLQALQYITGLLNEYLQVRYSTAETCALLGSPVNADGSSSPAAADKILFTLMSVDRSAAKAPIAFGYRGAVEKPKEDATTGNYTVYMLISANFAEYTKALDMLDHAMSFFIGKPLLEPATQPDMPPRIAKLEIVMEPSDALQMRSIWLALGARYQPSVVYKVTVTGA